MISESDLTKRKCFDVYTENDVECEQKDCRHWIDYSEDLNCSIICANTNGPLTLHETAKRLKISFVRVKQNQDRALQRLCKQTRRKFENIFD